MTTRTARASSPRSTIVKEFRAKPTPERGGITVAHGEKPWESGRTEQSSPARGDINFRLNKNQSELCRPWRGFLMFSLYLSHDLRHGLLICRPFRGLSAQACLI